jgi:biopolymer transport protein ExbD
MNFKGRNKISPEFNMSSMTDIVFLLLIFFMIASTLSKQLDTINVELPKAKGKTENRRSVAVSISSSSVFFVDDQIVNKKNIQETILNQMKGINPPSLILRAAKNVSIDEVVFIMDIANKNSIKVVLAVDAN